MDPGVSRYLNWWGTALVGLGLVFVGTFGHVWMTEDIKWYRTDVVENGDVGSYDVTATAPGYSTDGPYTVDITYTVEGTELSGWRVARVVFDEGQPAWE